MPYTNWIHDPVMGKIMLPEFAKVRFLPGSTVGSAPIHQGVFRFVHRDGGGSVKDAGYSIGIVPDLGLMQIWEETEAYQILYPTAADFIQGFHDRMRALGDPRFGAYYFNELTQSKRYQDHQIYWAGNERVDNGGKMAEKLLYNVATPDHAPSFPVYLALGTSGFSAAAHGDLSIGSATHFVTTNEWTNHGLARFGAITPTNTDPSALDGQYQVVVTTTFTDTSGGDQVNGGALFDNTVGSGTSNMYCEATATAATLNLNDTYAATWTNKG